eukprot:7396308-Pyramimonas_sp.AAC.1
MGGDTEREHHAPVAGLSCERGRNSGRRLVRAGNGERMWGRPRSAGKSCIRNPGNHLSKPPVSSLAPKTLIDSRRGDTTAEIPHFVMPNN